LKEVNIYFFKMTKIDLKGYHKVIIWGYPLYSHTHSYIHEAYYKAFKYLGCEVYWFHDNDYPHDFDFNNCLFIGEGFADAQIPLNKTSCYFIMYCPSPKKYIEAEVKKYIDVRMAAFNFKDHIHNYSLNKEKCLKVGPGCYFEPKTNQNIKIINDYHNYEIENFDKFYISWATNLLPFEFDENVVYKTRENNIYFCGNLSNNGVCENFSTFEPFIQECQKNNINFYHNNSWSHPLSSETVTELTQKSFLAVDIRGPEHLKNGLLTCRISKNISYGQLGLTNSSEIYKELDGNCILNKNTAELFYDGLKYKEDFNLIKSQMRYIKDNHTYINRIKAFLSIL